MIEPGLSFSSYQIRQDLASQSQHRDRGPSSQQQMDAIAVDLLGDRVVQLEARIQALSRDVDLFQDQSIRISALNLPRESEQLIDIANTLIQSTASTRSRISDASSNLAPTVIHIDNNEGNLTTTIDDDELNYASSLHGAPMGPQARQRIKAWIGAISSASGSTVKDISAGLSDESLGSESVSTQFTSPSTVRKSPNVRVQLAEARLQKAQELMAKKRFKEAITFFERSIEDLKTNPHYFSSTTTLRYLQLNLARAMIKSQYKQGASEPVLREVLNHRESSTEERSEAAHEVASLLLKNDGTDLQEAKNLSELAVTLRAESFGQDDPKTHESIALSAAICCECGDPDYELWRAMLPKSYKDPVSSLKKLSQYPKDKECRILGITLALNGELLVTLSKDLREPGKELIAFWKLPEQTLVFEAPVKRKNPDQRIWEYAIFDSVSMALSPDNKLLVVGNRDYEQTGNPFYLGRVQSGTSVACHSLSNAYGKKSTALAFQPNGDLLAWVQGGAIKISQYKDGKMQIHLGKLTYDLRDDWSLGAFSYDNKYFAVTEYGSGTIVLFDLHSRMEVQRLDSRNILLHTNDMASLLQYTDDMAFSLHGHLLVGAFQAIHVFDISSKTVLRKSDSKIHNVAAMAPLFDNKIIVAGLTNDTPSRVTWSELETEGSRDIKQS